MHPECRRRAEGGSGVQTRILFDFWHSGRIGWLCEAVRRSERPREAPEATGDAPQYLLMLCHRIGRVSGRSECLYRSRGGSSKNIFFKCIVPELAPTSNSLSPVNPSWCSTPILVLLAATYSMPTDTLPSSPFQLGG